MKEEKNITITHSDMYLYLAAKQKDQQWEDRAQSSPTTSSPKPTMTGMPPRLAEGLAGLESALNNTKKPIKNPKK